MIFFLNGFASVAPMMIFFKMGLNGFAPVMIFFLRVCFGDDFF